MILSTLITSQLHFEMCAGLYGHPVFFLVGRAIVMINCTIDGSFSKSSDLPKLITHCTERPASAYLKTSERFNLYAVTICECTRLFLVKCGLIPVTEKLKVYAVFFPNQQL